MNRIRKPLTLLIVLLVILIGLALVHTLTDYNSLFDPVLKLLNKLKSGK